MNYKALLRVFRGTEQREAYFREQYSDILGEDVVEGMIELGFLTAPASVNHHGNYAGGLFDHSVNVANVLADLSRHNELLWENGSIYKTPIRIGILHDLCKVDNYVEITDENGTGIGQFKYSEEPLIKGHGTKSIIYAQLLGAKLTAEELACINYHMGAFTDAKEWKNYTSAVQAYPNVLWTHTADMIASQILGV